MIFHREHRSSARAEDVRGAKLRWLVLRSFRARQWQSGRSEGTVWPWRQSLCILWRSHALHPEERPAMHTEVRHLQG